MADSPELIEENRQDSPMSPELFEVQVRSALMDLDVTSINYEQELFDTLRDLFGAVETHAELFEGSPLDQEFHNVSLDGNQLIMPINSTFIYGRIAINFNAPLDLNDEWINAIERIGTVLGKHLDTNLRIKNKILQTRQEALSNIAHKIGNSAATVKTSTYLFDRVTSMPNPDPAKVAEITSRVVKNTTAMVEIASTFTTAANISNLGFTNSDKPELYTGEKFKADLDAMLIEFEEVKESLDVSIHPEVLNGGFTISKKFLEGIRELISNAYDFNTDVRVKVDIKIEDGLLVATVQDNGKGFNTNVLNGPFSRGVDKIPPSLKFGNNMGLGITLVKGIADASNGTFDIRSSESGTTATIKAKL